MSGSRDDQKSPEEKALAAHGITFKGKLYFSPDKRWVAVIREDELFGEITTHLDIFHISRKFDKIQSYFKNSIVEDKIECKLLWFPDSSGIVVLFEKGFFKPAYFDLKTKEHKLLDEQRFNMGANFSSEAKLQIVVPYTKEKIEYDFPQVATVREKIKSALEKELKAVSTAPEIRGLMMEHYGNDNMLELMKQFCEAQKFHASSRLPAAIRDQMEGYQDEYEYRIFLEKDEKSPDRDARAKKAAIEYLSTYLTEHPEKTPAECVAETVKQHPGAITRGSKKIKNLFESISKMQEPKQVNASAGGLFAVDVKAENPPFIDFLQNWVLQNNSAAGKKQLVAEVESMLKTAQDYQKKGILEVNVAKFAGVLQKQGVDGVEKFLDSKKVVKNRKG